MKLSPSPENSGFISEAGFEWPDSLCPIRGFGKISFEGSLVKSLELPAQVRFVVSGFVPSSARSWASGLRPKRPRFIYA